MEMNKNHNLHHHSRHRLKRQREQQQQEQQQDNGDGDDAKKRNINTIPPNKKKKNNNNTTVSLLTHNDITNMDVTQYIRYVNNQAKTLPSISISNTSTSTNASSTTVVQVVNDNQPLHKNQKLYHNNNNQNQNQQQQQYIPTGCAGSIQYWLNGSSASASASATNNSNSNDNNNNNNSIPIELYPPPTKYHLPLLLLSSSSSSTTNKNASTTTTIGKDDNSDYYTKQWVNETIQNFQQLRTYLETCHTTNKQQKQHQQKLRILVPPLKDRIGWYIFCMGTNSSTLSSYDDSRNNNNEYADANTNTNADADQMKDDTTNFIKNEKKINKQQEENINNDENDDINDNVDDNDDDNDDDNTDFILNRKGENVNNSLLQSNGMNSMNPNTSTDIQQQVTVVWDDSTVPIHGYYPTVTLLLQMDQIMIRRIICHLTHYIQVHYSKFYFNNYSYNNDDEGSNITTGSNYSNNLFVWIYSLLARLELPIHRDDCVTLYTLVKQLTYMRSKIVFVNNKSKNDNDDDDNDDNDNNKKQQQNEQVQRKYLASLNTIIVLIGIYFEQGGTYQSLMQVPVVL